MTTFHLPRPLLHRLTTSVFALVYAGLSLYLILLFLIGSALVDDNGRVPEVVQRPLVHAVSQGLVVLTPPAMRYAATEWLIAMRESETGQSILRLRYEDPHDFTDSVVGHVSDEQIFGTAAKLLVVYITLLLFMSMLYRLAGELFPESRSYRLLAPVIACMVIATFVSRFAYSYDFAELFFCCALMFWLRRERFGPYLLFLAVGTLNKETTGFAIVFFAVWFFERLPKQRYVVLLALQSAIYLVTRGTLAWIYGQYEYPYRLMQRLLSWYQYDYQDLIGLLGVAILVGFRWGEKPLFLRYALWMVLPNVAAYLLVAPPGEYRALYWSMPPMFLLATHSVVTMTGLVEAERRSSIDA